MSPREVRENVAKAIFCTASPGHRWDQQPPAVLEYWGNLADAALVPVLDALAQPETAAVCRAAGEEAAGGLDSRVAAGLGAVARLLSGRRS